MTQTTYSQFNLLKASMFLTISNSYPHMGIEELTESITSLDAVSIGTIAVAIATGVFAIITFFYMRETRLMRKSAEKPELFFGTDTVCNWRSILFPSSCQYR